MPRMTKIGTEVANVTYVTRTPLSRSKGQRSRSPGRFTHRRVGASGSCSGGRGNMLPVRNCCYIAVCSAARGSSASTGGGEGRGHIMAAARLQLVKHVQQTSMRSNNSSTFYDYVGASSELVYFVGYRVDCPS